MAETNKTKQTAEAHQPGVVVMPGGADQASAEPTPATHQKIDDNAEDETPSLLQPEDGDAITWVASEFVAHHKTVGWYAALAAVGAVIAAAVYLLTGDVISTAVVIVGVLALGYYAGRQPRQLGYRLDDIGVTIGEKQFSYEHFRSFAVVPEGAFNSIVFMPLKRFAPLTTIYFAPEDEDRIIDMLIPRLPVEEYKHDYVDRLMRRIRF